MSKKKPIGVQVGGVQYHPDHISSKEVFQKIFGKKKDWEDRWKKVEAAKKSKK